MENQWSRSKWLEKCVTSRRMLPLGLKWFHFRCLLMQFLSSLQLTALQAKVHYLRYLSELRLYGGREFKSILFGKAISFRNDEGLRRNLCLVKLDYWCLMRTHVLSVARGEADRSDAVSGPTIRHQPCHQHPHQPRGPAGRLQPRQPHRDPHRGRCQRPPGAARSGRQGEFISVPANII